MSSQDFFLSFFGLFFLIAINAFFTAAEFSIVSVRRSRITQLVQDGDIAAETVQYLQKSIDRLLSTTQLGITLSSLALGWIGERTIAVLVKQLIAKLPLPELLTGAIIHSLAIPIAFIFLVYLQIVLGELCPKSVALLYPEKLARFFAPPSLVIARIFRPFVGILNQSTHGLLKLFHIEYIAQEWEKKVTPEELQLIISTEKESIGLEAEEREILNNVFELGEVTAVEIMIPRTEIEFLPEEATFAKLLQMIATKGFFRYPIIGKSLDDIKGLIDYKSLAIPLAEGKLINDSKISQWMEDVNFIPETTPLNELLSIMQRSRQAMVIVIDEFGGTSGLITLQDLITEIIGDEGEPQETNLKLITRLDEQTFLVSAQISLEDVNESLELDLPLADDYHTLSGFLLEQWQKIPTQGETISYQNLDFTVIFADENKLEQIKVRKHAP